MPDDSRLEHPGDYATLNSCIAVWPPSDGLALYFWPRFLSLKIAQLVELEVCGLQTRATFEPDDPHTGLAELGREDRAGCPDADDHNICLFSCYGSARF